MSQKHKICPYRFKQGYEGSRRYFNSGDSYCEGDKCALWVEASWDGQTVSGCAKWVEVQLQYLRWVPPALLYGDE